MMRVTSSRDIMRGLIAGVGLAADEAAAGPDGAARAATMDERMASRQQADADNSFMNLSHSMKKVPGRSMTPLYTDRVATTGGTAAARSAGPSTASWPSSHNVNAPIGR
jgi:hypothetical protein